jgi:hypothetical protein
MEPMRSTSLPLKLRPIAQVIAFRSRPISWLPVYQVLARSLSIDARCAIVPSQEALPEEAKTDQKIHICHGSSAW